MAHNESIDHTAATKIAVFCVGNKLMLDDGVGCAVFEELTQVYSMPDSVDVFDVGCMSLDMISAVDEYDVLVTVDALDGTGAEPGTVFRFEPDDVARNTAPKQSAHDMRLSDLFDAATLVGYHAEGVCLGVQVENMSPAQLTIGLTPKVCAALPLLVETVLAEIIQRGISVFVAATGEEVGPGWRHPVIQSE